MLGKAQAQVPVMNTVHSLINQYAGANAGNVGIAIPEANATSYRDTAPNGLFAPDDGTADGALVQPWACTGQSDQRWSPG